LWSARHRRPRSARGPAGLEKPSRFREPLARTP
jgi:hypothetical protein